MKIGILTFHWGTNYGGVLQSFALQTFLKNKGFDVEVINYAPHTFRDSLFKCFYSKNPFAIIDNLKNYWKEKNIAKFRKKHLDVTERYYTPEQLIENPPLMDVYISGSDQVWNPYGLKSNKKIYFLPFGSKDSIKIAYATSFGVTQYPSNLLEELKPLLEKFNAISVRENSGIEILKKAGIEKSVLMPDPTLLLNKDDYAKILEDNCQSNKSDYFFYVLQKNQVTINEIYLHFKKDRHNRIVHSCKAKHSVFGIEEWLNYIKNSKLVVTNSFHGVIFSLIFNTPFIVVPIEGQLSGMNDRIITLLERFELMDRVVEKYDEIKINELTHEKIIWEAVDKIHQDYKKDADSFFKNLFSNFSELKNC